MPTLSPRQEQILVLLNKGMSAREIGDELGVTRNAIYQQITNLRKLGALSSEYTPSGEPARMAPIGQIARRSGLVDKAWLSWDDVGSAQ